MFGPISPHLLIYKPQYSSIFSVLHRGTGAILAIGFVAGLFLFNFGISLVSFHRIYYIMFILNTYASWFLISLLLIVMFSFFYHLSNGVRHLVWDFGSEKFLSKDMVRKTGLVVLGCSLILSVLFILSIA